MTYEFSDGTPTGLDAFEAPGTFGDRDGVQIRELGIEDQAMEAKFLERLSFAARRLRFVGQMADSEGLLAQGLSQFDFERDTTFAATVPDGAGCVRIEGIARYSLDSNGGKCECAVTLADAAHEPELELTLMRRLVELARSRGIRSLYSTDAVADAGKRKLAEQLGFRVQRHPRDPALCIHRLEM